MMSVDLWACVAAGVASAALAVRANMLKPSHQTWSPAPTPVWVTLMALSIVLAMAAISIGGGAHATAREAVVYTISAASSLVLIWNLHRNSRADAEAADRHASR